VLLLQFNGSVLLLLSGGAALPSNAYYLAQVAEGVHVDLPLLLMARQINDSMPLRMLAYGIQELRRMGKHVTSNAVAMVMGISYEKDVADTKMTPAADLVCKLKESFKEVRLCDPFLAGATFQGLPVYPSPLSCAAGVDIAFIVTNHKLFRDHFSLTRLQHLTQNSHLVVIDGRHMYNEQERPSGLSLAGIGRTAQSGTPPLHALNQMITSWRRLQFASPRRSSNKSPKPLLRPSLQLTSHCSPRCSPRDSSPLQSPLSRLSAIV